MQSLRFLLKMCFNIEWSFLFHHICDEGSVTKDQNFVGSKTDFTPWHTQNCSPSACSVANFDPSVVKMYHKKVLTCRVHYYYADLKNFFDPSISM